MNYTKEEFEFAARACGYRPIYGRDAIIGAIINGNQCYSWNPTESDADAFRAMVDGKLFKNYDLWLELESICDDHNDKAAAARHAIMQCLVQIGRSMEKAHE